ncbi:MAG: family 65 glycosyl hydrolase domain-containing protein [Clostridia bacterium]|nr:family 65 glycosyl hydrolase domain-containing protein [Clostridia bacterium]
MIEYLKAKEWSIVEEGFDPKLNRFSESILSLGNEHMGLRGFFEEGYSGDSLQGTYVAGVYYPDKTRVGWWKNGYPDFFAKVINSTNWIGIEIYIDGDKLDLAGCRVENFTRELDMRNGTLTRRFTAVMDNGKKTGFCFTRFLSMADNEIACISVGVEPLNYSGKLTFIPFLDGDVSNEDSNYGEKFWIEVNKKADESIALLTMQTKKTGFVLATAAKTKIFKSNQELSIAVKPLLKEKYAGQQIEVEAEQGSVVEVQKFVSVCTSRDHKETELEAVTLEKLDFSYSKGYDILFTEHCAEMARKWEDSDVVIEGDVKAQQGIRYNIFQLNQTYTGKDPRLNIGPKGFTGEKYGGSTYWDTEAYCFPFYLYTNQEVARNLLYYRYLHLERAKENAAKLGFKGALYPMVTMDGQECHNEWEITFEEIHRNGAIAYAIYNYTSYTGDTSYLKEYGIEVLVEISRFWADRVNYNPRKDKYMILGVTGPNEYENNVNNNWYTNTMASWTLEYTIESLELIKGDSAESYRKAVGAFKISEEELNKWKDIISKMYYPVVDELGIFEQNDLYMDKEQVLVKDLPSDVLPLNKHWSWDRILRSCFIKQADVLQGIYFFPDRYDTECMRRNFDFYEPRTVHESSLSPSIYSIVASWIGYKEKAYELYLRTARLDLDNYNDDTDDGVHLTSMSGSWLAIIQGFAGIKVKGSTLYLKPYLPEQWKGYSFKITFRGSKLKVLVNPGKVTIENISGEPISINLFERGYQPCAGSKIEAEM